MKKKFLFMFMLVLMFSVFSGFSYSDDYIKKGVVDYTPQETTETTETTTETQPSTDAPVPPLTEDALFPDVENIDTLNVIGEDYVAGDTLLPSDVSGEKFFSKIYRKTLGAVSGFQKIVAIIFIFFFIIAALMTVISFFGNKSHIPWYILAMIVSLIFLLCDLYAFQIASSFANWWNS